MKSVSFASLLSRLTRPELSEALPDAQGAVPGGRKNAFSGGISSPTPGDGPCGRADRVMPVNFVFMERVLARSADILRVRSTRLYAPWQLVEAAAQCACFQARLACDFGRMVFLLAVDQARLPLRPAPSRFEVEARCTGATASARAYDVRLTPLSGTGLFPVPRGASFDTMGAFRIRLTAGLRPYTEEGLAEYQRGHYVELFRCLTDTH